jgi:hypothetical protein
MSGKQQGIGAFSMKHRMKIRKSVGFYARDTLGKPVTGTCLSLQGTATSSTVAFKQKCKSQIHNNSTLQHSTNDVFGAYCLRFHFHQLNCLQLTLNNPQSGMP